MFCLSHSIPSITVSNITFFTAVIIYIKNTRNVQWLFNITVSCSHYNELLSNV